MLAASKERLVRYFQRRSVAYKRVFVKESVYVQDVLADLAKFCRAHTTTFHKDERTHALLEGRKEVFLRIMENLNLSHEEIFNLHSVRNRDEEQKQ